MGGRDGRVLRCNFIDMAGEYTYPEKRRDSQLPLQYFVAISVTGVYLSVFF